MSIRLAQSMLFVWNGAAMDTVVYVRTASGPMIFRPNVYERLNWVNIVILLSLVEVLIWNVEMVVVPALPVGHQLGMDGDVSPYPSRQIRTTLYLVTLVIRLLCASTPTTISNVSWELVTARLVLDQLLLLKSELSHQFLSSVDKIPLVW